MKASFDSMVRLSRLIQRLGQVHRVTTDVRGRRESDTTHSLMLALLAGELAEEGHMNPLDVVAMALVHDLAEAYAGDVNTLVPLSAEDRAEKDRREAEALVQVRKDLADFPWILGYLDRYEALVCPESRFVRVLDKVMPKLTHADSGFAVPKAAGMTRDGLAENHRAQGRQLRTKYPEQELALEVFDMAARECEKRWDNVPFEKRMRLPYTAATFVREEP